MRPPDLSVFAEGHCASLHVQDAGDVVALCVAGQRERLLPVVVQVATVSTVQPHVSRGAVVEVMYGPARYTHARSLVPSVLLHYVELTEKTHTHLPDTQDTGYTLELGNIMA